MRRIRKTALYAILLLALVYGLAGCHGYYSLVIENHRSDPVEISFPNGTQVMRPCSVMSWGTSGPSAGSTLLLTAKDASGQVVYSTKIKSRRGQALDAWVTIPAVGNDTCPAPAQTFYLNVSNYSSQAVRYYQSGQLVGTAGPKTDTRVGPFAGAWPDVNGVTYRKGDGEEKPLPLQSAAHFDLGAVPEFGIGVEEWY